MTELQYEFLCRYRDTDIPSPNTMTTIDRGFFKACKSADYIQISVLPNGNWVLRISDTGKAAMSEFENEAKRKAEENAERKAEQTAQEQAAQRRWSKDDRRSWFQFWLNVLFSAVGFAAGVLVEHYFTILDLLHALF